MYVLYYLVPAGPKSNPENFKKKMMKNFQHTQAWNPIFFYMFSHANQKLLLFHHILLLINPLLTFFHVFLGDTKRSSLTDLYFSLHYPTSIWVFFTKY